jgi:hypothetical protein
VNIILNSKNQNDYIDVGGLNMLPTTRKQAKELGQKYYFTGKKCPQNHTSKRYSHNGVCYDCVMESNKKWYDRNKTDIEWRRKRLFKFLENRAIRGSIPFELEYNDIDWPTHCPVFGVELCYDSIDGVRDNSASFDKVDPKLGYVKNNVNIISHRANWLKQDSTIEQLQNIIQYMKRHNEHILSIE